MGLHSSIFGKSILQWVCCAWWWELGHTICLRTDFSQTETYAGDEYKQPDPSSYSERWCKAICRHFTKDLISAPTPWLVVISPHRESITSLGLLAMLCFMQPRKLLAFAAAVHCQDMVNLVSTRDPRSSSDQLIFSQPALCLYLCFSLFLSRCGTLHFLLLESFLPLPSPAVNY